MYVLSVNVGQARPSDAKRVGKTGIFKQAQTEPVWVGTLGLAGDAICDTENHGGADQAVYIYGTPDYDWWAAELGRPLAPGTFGENLTISGFVSADYAVGDCLQIGDVTLQITSPRLPCVTLARRMDDPAFLKRFRAAERPGVYCRVLQAGPVAAGTPVTLLPYDGERMSMREMYRDGFAPTLTVAALQRYLAAPIAERARTDMEQQLRKLQSKGEEV